MGELEFSFFQLGGCPSFLFSPRSRATGHVYVEMDGLLKWSLWEGRLSCENQLCTHPSKGQAAIENSPAQLPLRQRHPSIFASCCLAPPDSGAGFAFGPEKWEQARLESWRQLSSGFFFFFQLKIKSKSSVIWKNISPQSRGSWPLGEFGSLWKSSETKEPFLECF